MRKFIRTLSIAMLFIVAIGTGVVTAKYAASKTSHTQIDSLETYEVMSVTYETQSGIEAIYTGTLLGLEAEFDLWIGVNDSLSVSSRVNGSTRVDSYSIGTTSSEEVWTADAVDFFTTPYMNVSHEVFDGYASGSEKYTNPYYIAPDTAKNDAAIIVSAYWNEVLPEDTQTPVVTTPGALIISIEDPNTTTPAAITISLHSRTVETLKLLGYN